MTKAKPTVPATTIMHVLEARIGTIRDLQQMAEGEDSQAFRFRHEGAGFVIRINPSRDGFDKDRFAFDAFAGPSLPIPEVIANGSIDHDHAYCVSRLVQGVTLQDLEPERLHHTLLPTAHVLDAIASADLAGTSGYGPFNTHGEGRYDSWRAFLLDFEQPDQLSWAAVGGTVGNVRIDRYLNEIARCALGCPDERRLVHGDFGSNNVLTDGHTITGVIDWSEAMFGDPFFDIANIFFWRTWLTCMEHQARYYERTLPHTADIEHRLRCYQLRIGLAEIQDAAGDSSTELLEWAVNRCDEVLAGER